ncbi:uncharacterized protein BO72DRAFT_105645 [Aspergillus fijiensis CBS 313.89]|uniref:F-box domain-containing protein n=1 Tax=Aspergillus fijiensis CBS 313.89 TaxID=1448319 RepID=A0A8G1VZL0_9EURO|nr:uncharacterized protein BO72DRAFT_105645 [Aspergillus fijiensis CBS 313.89]RAK77431.1 hypothetical protein BO72DRAFT_105645 [Aspergillus fijiensis CBS 313.89]
MPALRRSKRFKNSENEISRPLGTPDIFLVPEIVEAILLRLDMHTLLISARVCATWNALIKSSRRIQQALFYVPIDTDTRKSRRKTRKNPLVMDKIWFEFIFVGLNSRRRHGAWHCPSIASEKRERAYLRPEASWRRMLLQQPPTSIVRFWNPECLWGPYWHILPKDQMVKTGAEWTPDGDYLRMENVAYEVDTGAISAGPLPFLCWADAEALRKVMRKSKRRKQVRRDRTLKRYLRRFDLTINTECPEFWPIVWIEDHPVPVRDFRQFCETRDVKLLIADPR